MARHYGLDWLRIGAFALLIFYHIGMFFVPWEWHVKTAEPVDWVAVPMLATNSWRIPLLFVVSGYATRAVLMRAASKRAFARDRTVRLMIPTLFAIVLIIPPQLWVELMVKHGYDGDYGTFWLTDYFRFGALDGLVMPTWQHLWFVVYLWVYTVVLALVAALIRNPAQIAAWADRLMSGAGLYLVPLAWLGLGGLVILPGVGVTHGFFDDPTSHWAHIPQFLFGVLLGNAPGIWATIRATWGWALAIAIASYLIVAAMEIAWPGDTPLPRDLVPVFRMARIVQGWCAIVALLGIADHYWNHDHRWRATLTEAVFPFYIIHQTIIVVLGWWALRFALPPAAEFTMLTIATIAGCWLFYDVGRRIGPLRRLVGLRPQTQPG